MACYIAVGQYCDILEHCDLLELEIRDSCKKPYCDCFFPFHTTMFSSTAVPTVQEFRDQLT